MIALLPQVHPLHGWVVDVATHRVTRGLCLACAAVAVETDPDAARTPAAAVS